MAQEEHCYKWTEKMNGRVGRYYHLFLAVPPNALEVYRPWQEVTTTNHGLIVKLLKSLGKLYYDADEGPMGLGCFNCNHCRW